MNTRSILTGKIVVPFTLLCLLIIAFWIDDFQSIFSGYCKIVLSSGILITDYLAIGGLAATLFNVVTLVFVYYILINSLSIKISGPIFAGLLTIAGFAFFGKNILNTAPILFGTYTYSYVNKINIKNVIIIVLFSTGISPIVSFTMFHTGLPYLISVPLGVLMGFFTGFILPPFAAHTVKFHSGYDLYNIGFAMGILALVYTAFFKAFGIIVETQSFVNDSYHTILLILLLVFSLIFILIAYLIDKRVHKKYFLIMEKSGRLVTDFVRDVGLAPTMLNIGLMGILSITFILVLNIKISGPVVGGVLTVIGFAAFGKHIKNSIPVMLGVTLAAFLSHYSLNSVGVVIAIFFGTALAPVCGRYGFVIGFFAGFVHFFVVQATSPFQGGFDLYNNGFAAGFVAAIFIPVLESFRKDIV